MLSVSQFKKKKKKKYRQLPGLVKKGTCPLFLFPSAPRLECRHAGRKCLGYEDEGNSLSRE